MSRANPEIAPTNNLDDNYASLVDDLTACQREQERVLLQSEADSSDYFDTFRSTHQ